MACRDCIISTALLLLLERFSFVFFCVFFRLGTGEVGDFSWAFLSLKQVYRLRGFGTGTGTGTDIARRKGGAWHGMTYQASKGVECDDG